MFVQVGRTCETGNVAFLLTYCYSQREIILDATRYVEKAFDKLAEEQEMKKEAMLDAAEKKALRDGIMTALTPLEIIQLRTFLLWLSECTAEVNDMEKHVSDLCKYI